MHTISCGGRETKFLTPEDLQKIVQIKKYMYDSP